MNKPNKETIHKHYFSLFTKAYNKVPTGEISYTDKPDVIIRGDKIIGIEITNLYLQDGILPESEQRQRTLRKLIISSAHQKYLNECGKKINISFGFDSNIPIKNKDKLIKKIVDLAKQLNNNKSGVVYEAMYKDIPEINFISVNSIEFNKPMWQIFQVYSGQTMSKDNLINKIREKEIKANDYQKCDEYWLLFVVDSIDRAQDQEIEIEGMNDIKSNIFNKVIIYKSGFDHIVMLGE